MKQLSLNHWLFIIWAAPENKRKIVYVSKEGYLEGQLLLAMPGMTDPRFERCVIYICTHNEEGAMGLIINRPCANIDFPSLLEQLDVEFDSDDLISSERGLEDIIMHEGGPVEVGRGFILHSADYVQESTLIISETIALTATIDILSAIACDEGPKDFLVALGYAGWSSKQLDEELQGNSWLSIEADDELVFRTDLFLKWPRAMAKLGVDITKLSANVGNA